MYSAQMFFYCTCLLHWMSCKQITAIVAQLFICHLKSVPDCITHTLWDWFKIGWRVLIWNNVLVSYVIEVLIKEITLLLENWLERKKLIGKAEDVNGYFLLFWFRSVISESHLWHGNQNEILGLLERLTNTCIYQKIRQSSTHENNFIDSILWSIVPQWNLKYAGKCSKDLTEKLRAKLPWIIDYFSNRKQFLPVKESKSCLCNQIYGVPQGSTCILGSLFFFFT